MTAFPINHHFEENSIRIGSRIEVDPKDVLFFKAKTNYTIVYLNSGEYFLVSTTLKIIQDRFNCEAFFRSHRSFLINLDYVKNVSEDASVVKMANNIDLQISRRKKEGLLIALSNKSIA